MNEQNATTSLEKQQEKLILLRAELDGEFDFTNELFGTGQYFFIRWLEEKRYILKQAAEAIRKYMQYRLDNDLDQIDVWKPNALSKNELVYEFCGFNNKSPVYFLPWGSWDIRKVVDAGFGKDVIKVIVQLLEAAMYKACVPSPQNTKLQVPKQETDELGRLKAPGATILVDVTNFQLNRLMSKATLGFIIQKVKVVDAFYAPMVDHVICGNAPRAISVLWAIVRPFIKKEFQNKIQILSTADSLEDALNKANISRDVVSTCLGGTYESKLNK